jgi:uncharacterized OsmC-like protein
LTIRVWSFSLSEAPHMTKPLKRWSVNAFAEGMNPISYFFDGRPIGQKSQADWQDLSPVQHLLIGVAGCFALSCRAVFLQLKRKDIGLEVVVTGEKAAGPGNRLSTIVVAAIFTGNLTRADEVALLEAAKPMCTVANTLLDGPSIVYQTRTIGKNVPCKAPPEHLPPSPASRRAPQTPAPL